MTFEKSRRREKISSQGELLKRTNVLYQITTCICTVSNHYLYTYCIKLLHRDLSDLIQYMYMYMYLYCIKSLWMYMYVYVYVLFQITICIYRDLCDLTY